MTSENNKRKSAVALTLSPEVSACFHTLRDRILVVLDGKATGHTLVVTSCHRGEGVTAVALNLALAFADAEHGSVLLCDANFASPAIHKVFKVPEGPGFTDAMAGKCDLQQSIRGTGLDALDVLPVGTRRMRPLQTVDPTALGSLIASVKDSYSAIIFDAPPLFDYSASARLAAASDGAVLVIEAERQRWEVAQKATDLLADAGATILGAVLNKRKFHIPGFLYRRL